MRVAVIGAGPAGLAAAYDLSRSGHAVTVFESDPAVGGLAGGFRSGRWEWSLEKYYHHWFQSDRAVLGLVDELGASGRIRFTRPATVVYHAGRFHPFDSPWRWLTFPGFSWLDAVRFGAVGAYFKARPDGTGLECYTADEWLRSRLGDRAYETVWRPMLVGKFGPEYYRGVNLAWMWARINSRTMRLGTFAGGFQAFFDLLAAAVRSQGGEIVLESPVTRVAANEDRMLTIEARGGAETFDHCIVTASPRGLLRIAPDLPEAYRAQLRALKSLGAVVLVLALDRQLTGHYWFNLPKDAGFPFLALVEHTNFVPSAHYGGDHILYCGDYLPSGHEHFELRHEALLERFLPALRRFNPAFDRSWIRDSWVWRTPYAQPVPLVNHSRNIPAIRTPVHGLWAANMSQVYPWDRGTNYAVELGRRVAKMVIECGAPNSGEAPC